MPYKVIDIYKDLPKTNCGECEKPGCFAFATAVFLQGTPLADCPYLDPTTLAQMQKKLADQKAQTGGEKPEKSKQALSFLIGKMGDENFARLADRCGGRYLPGPPEAIHIRFLDREYEILKDDVLSLTADETPTIWIKIFLMIYAARCNGEENHNQWVAFRELPNAIGKSKSFDECTDQVAAHFSGRQIELDEICLALGGEAIDGESADRAYLFLALPLVKLKLLFWDGDEDFEARASLLLDGNILAYLDHEAIVFLAEAFSNRLLGKGYEGVIP